SCLRVAISFLSLISCSQLRAKCVQRAEEIHQLAVLSFERIEGSKLDEQPRKLPLNFGELLPLSRAFVARLLELGVLGLYLGPSVVALVQGLAQFGLSATEVLPHGGQLGFGLLSLFVDLLNLANLLSVRLKIANDPLDVGLGVVEDVGVGH